MSAARPLWCTTTMAFVLSVSRCRTVAGVMLSVSGSMSAKTGTRP